MSTNQQLEKAILSMTEDQRNLFITIFDLVYDRPDLLEFASQWKGRMSDLPEALKAIK
jgi:hypothetical protein